jgi:hypothetical protein
VTARRRRTKSPAARGSSFFSPTARRAILLFVLTFALYNANGRLIGAGDSYPARFIPFGILQHGTVFLDPIRDLVAMHHAQPYWIQPALGGRSASLYPVVLPVVATPLYLPALGYLAWTDSSPGRMERVGELMEKFVASLAAAIASALLYPLLLRRLQERAAFWLTLLLAFGTTTWPVSAQAMWQHGLGELCIAAMLLLVTGAPTWGRALALGAFAATALGNRPPDGLLIAGVGAYALVWAGRRWPAIAAGALPVLALTVWYNLSAFGNPGGGYGTITGLLFSNNVVSGVAGLLFSPGKGLVVFSPFWLFLAAVPRQLRNGSPWRGLDACILAGFAGELLFYGCSSWSGGFSWGYRLLTDFIPALAWLLAPVVAGLERRGRFLFYLAAAASIYVQFVGAFRYTGISQPALFTADHTSVSRNVWSWRHSPILVERRQPVQPPALLHTLADLAR